MDLNIDFIFVGPQRTGTTWIYEHLIQHPELCFPKGVKETMFFDRNFEKGIKWYSWHFSNSEYGQKCGEVAPTYFDKYDVPERIKNYFPKCKIIISLRDPIQRAQSLYRHHYQKGRISGTFTQSIEKMPNILTSGFYGDHIPKWLEFFDESQVLVISMKEISNYPDMVLKKICDFLNIDPAPIKDSIYKNKINISEQPRSLWLSKICSGIVTYLHDHRLYFLVNLAKKTGLKKLFFKRPAVKPNLTSDEINFLEERFTPHIAYIKNKFGKSISVNE